MRKNFTKHMALFFKGPSPCGTFKLMVHSTDFHDHIHDPVKLFKGYNHPSAPYQGPDAQATVTPVFYAAPSIYPFLLVKAILKIYHGAFSIYETALSAVFFGGNSPKPGPEKQYKLEPMVLSGKFDSSHLGTVGSNSSLGSHFFL